jgi:hypothetical protein
MIWMPLGMPGCSRTFWRDQAERDSYEAIMENLNDPQWAVPRIDLTPDPRSRFFDPYSIDYAPLPPDDPAAHVYMHWVDGWDGYDCWHAFGDLMGVENPQWLAPFGLRAENYDPETGEYVAPLPEIKDLTLGDAIELSLIHNRDYQTQIENVFLRALEVAAERYRFSVRYIGPGAGLLADFRPDGGGDSLTADVNFGWRQLLPSGGQWIVELTNNTIWLFGGPNRTTTASTLAFSLVQPLIRGGGRKVVLESLTQRERNLLYAVRDLARFRRIFFTNVVTGPSGFLSLLQQVQSIRNLQQNIRALEKQVETLKAVASQQPAAVREPLEAMPAGLDIPPELFDQLEFDAARQQLIWYGPITDQQAQQLLGLSNDADFQRAVNEIIQRLQSVTLTLDVLRLQSQLADSINGLRESEQRLQDSLDNFKILLGLRTDFLMTIDDSLLEPFQFIDPRLDDMEFAIETFVPSWGGLDAEEPDRAEVRRVALELSALVDEAITNGLGMIREDFGNLEEVYDDRLKAMETDEERARLEYDVQRDRRLYDDSELTLTEVQEAVRNLLVELEDPSLDITRVKLIIQEIKFYQEELLQRVRGLKVIQIGLRAELIDLEPFEMAMEEAVAIGLENRLDLKNARADVMDARRKVEVAANALQSFLDLRLEADVNTPRGDNPLDFQGDLSDLRAGIAFDAPLDINVERNVYRASLVEYQRARRDYMLLEDRVKQEIRADWRQLEVQRRNLETTKQAVRIAAAQFDSAVAQAFAPARVGQQPSSGTGGLSGQNIQNALNSVLRAQNEMISTWVQYERNRLNIYRDMDIMDVGPDGVWNDPFYREQTRGSQFDAPGEQPIWTDEFADPLGPDVTPELNRLDETDANDLTREPLDTEVQSLDRAVGAARPRGGRGDGSGVREAGADSGIRQAGWRRILPFRD